PQEGDGRARGDSEGCAGQGRRGSERRETARGRRICRREKRGRGRFGATGGGDCAPHPAGACAGRSPKRGAMKLARNLHYSLMAFAGALFSAAAVCGAEEGGSPAGQPIGMIFKWIHFVILAGLAYWVFGKLLPPFFRHQADHISAAIGKATAAKTDAEQRLQQA